MNFSGQLIKARIIKRYNRFLADVTTLDEKKFTVYVPNTGSLKTCWETGDEVWLEKSTNLDRKLPYTLVAIQRNTSLIGLYSALANNLVEEALTNGKMEDFGEIKNCQREVKHARSRFDFLLNDSTYVEVKSVTMTHPEGLYPETAYFPDAVTTRGTKHLEDLTSMKKSGLDTGIIYVIQRENIKDFAVADFIDPDYANAFEEAQRWGVKFAFYNCSFKMTEIGTSSINIHHSLQLR